MWRYRGQARPPFAEAPGPGQESVWDYPRPPRIEPSLRHVTVSADGRKLATTRRALRVLETASPPTWYLPEADIDMTALKRVDGASVCEWKGTAEYFALAGAPGSQVVAWRYPTPTDAFAAIRHCLSFYPRRVACFVDARRVRPQPGGFYGGWMTDDVAGPVKGEPGSAHW